MWKKETTNTEAHASSTRYPESPWKTNEKKKKNTKTKKTQKETKEKNKTEMAQAAAAAAARRPIESKRSPGSRPR
jgi:hypothetical protein